MFATATKSMALRLGPSEAASGLKGTVGAKCGRSGARVRGHITAPSKSPGRGEYGVNRAPRRSPCINAGCDKTRARSEGDTDLDFTQQSTRSGAELNKVRLDDSRAFGIRAGAGPCRPSWVDSNRARQRAKRLNKCRAGVVSRGMNTAEVKSTTRRDALDVIVHGAVEVANNTKSIDQLRGEVDLILSPATSSY